MEGDSWLGKRSADSSRTLEGSMQGICDVIAAEPAKSNQIGLSMCSFYGY
jgi:hypothetical protein